MYRTCHASSAAVCRHLTHLTISLPSHRALSSLSPRIPRTHSSRSSVCTEVLGRGAVQFGTAAIVHNGSERSDSRMYRNTRLHGVAPQKRAILDNPPKLPPFTRVQTCPNHPLSLRHYALRHSSASEIYHIRHDSFRALGPSSSLQIAAQKVVLCRPGCYSIFIAVSNIHFSITLHTHRSRS